MEEKPGGRCAGACMCAFVSYLAALFTSFASTDVAGEKLFLKAHLKELRCYKTQHPHVFVHVCVRASERAQIDLTLSLQSRLCGSACGSYKQSAGGRGCIAELQWFLGPSHKGSIAPATWLAGKWVRMKWRRRIRQIFKKAPVNNPCVYLSTWRNNLSVRGRQAESTKREISGVRKRERRYVMERQTKIDGTALLKAKGQQLLSQRL